MGRFAVFSKALLFCLFLLFSTSGAWQPAAAAEFSTLDAWAEKLQTELYVHPERRKTFGPAQTKALEEAMTSRDLKAARALARLSLMAGNDDAEDWIRLAKALNFSNKQRGALPREAMIAAWIARQRAEANLDSKTAGSALFLAANSATNARQWNLARALATRGAESTDDSRFKGILARLEKVAVLKIADYEIQAERSRPMVCVEMSDELPSRPEQTLSDYVTVTPSIDMAVRPKDRDLCIEGFAHGERYELTIRKGLEAASGVTLARNETRDIILPDREPSLSFRQNGYVLPEAGSKGVPLVSINVAKIKLSLFRVPDRSLVPEMRQGSFGENLYPYDISNLEETRGEKLRDIELPLESAKNAEHVTALPVQDLITERKPGVYVLVAEQLLPALKERWSARAAQWFLISDLGLTSMNGQDGLNVFVHSLSSAKPRKNVRLRLIGRNNDILGEVTTDSRGHARLDPGLMRGEYGREPVSLTALAPDGDFVFLDLQKPAFDLRDRGVSGRAWPGPVDGFLYADRGIYRPGETAELMVVARDQAGKAVTDLPVTLKLIRPDGVVARQMVLETAESLKDSGAWHKSLAFDRAARTGKWSVTAHLTEKGPEIGRTDFLIEDFVPPKIEVSLSSDQESLQAGELLQAGISGQYYYGSPASALTGQAEAVLETDPAPFASYKDWRFGLEQEEFLPISETLPVVPTDAEGKSEVVWAVPEKLDSNKPLRVKLRGVLFEDSGRAVADLLTLPVRHMDSYIGIRPAFTGDRVSMGASADLEVIALDKAGTPVTGDLEWELYREHYEYVWYHRYGRWGYEVFRSDDLQDSGKLAVKDENGTRLSFRKDWGHYRLEVLDPKTRSVSSYRFAFGWSSQASADATPDRLGITLDQESYKPGESARVLLDAPWKGRVLLTVLGDGVRSFDQFEVNKGENSYKLKVQPEWGVGAYVTATLLRPAGDKESHGPGRAIGLSWLPLKQDERKLAVTIETPEKITPNQELLVPVSVSGKTRGDVFVTLAAVDDAVLGLTRFTTPDPESHYFGKRRLHVDIRDIYGRLIDGRQGEMADLRSGGGAFSTNAGPGKRSSKVVALFSGMVSVKDGKAEIPLSIPDFNGRLRLMAVAFGPDSMGHGDNRMLVRAPLVADMSLPRFLAPRDLAESLISLDNQDGAAGDYRISVTATGPVSLQGEAERSISLKPGDRQTFPLDILAEGVGDSHISLTVEGPEDLLIAREWDLSVRPAWNRRTRQISGHLEAGKSLNVDQAPLLDFMQGEITLTASSGPNINVGGLLARLDRYPYGCLEQTTSRALPLLYLSSVARQSGLIEKDEAALKARLQKAIGRVLGMQRAEGSFGLWSSNSEEEPWLSAYVMDFLTRARKEGYQVDDFSFERGLTWLANFVRPADFSGPAQATAAYAHYVLAANNRVDPGDLRYFADEYGTKLPNSLSMAQLGAALNLLGDQERAGRQFTLARAFVRSENGRNGLDYYSYGSFLRDQAGLLTLAAATEDSWAGIFPLVSRLEQSAASQSHTSTQEKAWMLLAAQSVLEKAGPLKISVNGENRAEGEKLFSWTPDEDSLRRGVVLKNEGDAPLSYTLEISGIPVEKLPPENDGITLTRRYFTPDGKELSSPLLIDRNSMLVAVITGELTAPSLSKREVLVVDLLPSGLELENAAFGNGSNRTDMSWLPKLTRASHEELRDDRYVAALSLNKGDKFTLAYLVRAVTPGRFVLPAVAAEDMYEPTIMARGAVERLGIQNKRQ